MEVGTHRAAPVASRAAAPSPPEQTRGDAAGHTAACFVTRRVTPRQSLRHLERDARPGPERGRRLPRRGGALTSPAQSPLLSKRHHVVVSGSKPHGVPAHVRIGGQGRARCALAPCACSRMLARGQRMPLRRWFSSTLAMGSWSQARTPHRADGLAQWFHSCTKGR